MKKLITAIISILTLWAVVAQAETLQVTWDPVDFIVTDMTACGYNVYKADVATGEKTLLGTVPAASTMFTFLDDTNALATLAHAVTHLSSGDTLYLKRGSTWRETLTIPASNITIDAYDTGADPIISGADIVTGGWTQYSGNIYYATVTGTTYQTFNDGGWVNLSHEPDGSTTNIAVTGESSGMPIHGGPPCGISTSYGSDYWTVTHNDLTNIGYIGISGRLNWVIDYNTITNSMLWLNDGGAIYIPNYNAGNFIRHNTITDVGLDRSITEGITICGIYLDQGSYNNTVEDNTVTRGGVIALFSRFGDNNKWRRNIATDYLCLA